MDTTTPKRFDKAFAALVAAFFNNTLAKGNCAACAIGNITASANGVKLYQNKEDGKVNYDQATMIGMISRAADAGIKLITPKAKNQKKSNCSIGGLNLLDHTAWSNLFMTDVTVGLQSDPGLMRVLELATDEMQEQGRFVLSATGYEVPELMKVEKAFEHNSKILCLDYPKHTEAEIKSDQYKGLCASIDALCSIEDLDPQPYREVLAYSVDPDFHPEHPEMVEQAYELATV